MASIIPSITQPTRGPFFQDALAVSFLQRSLSQQRLAIGSSFESCLTTPNLQGFEKLPVVNLQPLPLTQWWIEVCSFGWGPFPGTVTKRWLYRKYIYSYIHINILITTILLSGENLETFTFQCIHSCPRVGNIRKVKDFQHLTQGPNPMNRSRQQLRKADSNTPL